jgi:xanthine dehydrogenase YagR molybdenum-binding subunit
MEGTTMDVPTGRYVNGNLGDYHIASHADIPDMEVTLLKESDLASNPTGAKTLGEIAVVGSVAAVANAVAHANGLPVRDLPLTPEKLLLPI